MFSLACEQAVLFIPTPQSVDRDSVLVVALESDGGPKVFALAASEALISASVSGTVLALLEYEPDRTPLPFELGELRGSESGCMFIDEVPPDQIFLATLAEGGLRSPGWTPGSVDQLPAALQNLRIETGGRCRVDVCPRWETTAFVFPGSSESVLWGIGLGDGRAIFGTAAEETFVVDAAAAARPITKSVPHAAIRTAVTGPDGQHWFGAHWQVYRGELQGDTLELQPVGELSDDAYGHLTAPTSSTGEGMFSLTDQGRLLRFQGGDWEVLPMSFSRLIPGRSRFGGLAQIGPDEVVVTTPADLGVWRYRSGVLREETPPGLVQLAGAIRHIPSWGTVFLTVPDGFVYHHEGDAWALSEERLGVGARSIIPFEDGYLVGGEAGLLRQYIPGHGFCPGFQPTSATTRTLVEIEPGVVVVAGGLVDGVQGIGAVLRASRDGL